MAVTQTGHKMTGLTCGLFVWVCVALFSVHTSAQDLATTTPMSGLGFQIDSNLNLDSFEGATITWNRYSSENRGWRVALTPEIDNEQIPDDFSSPNYRETNNYYLEISVLKLFQEPPRDKSRFYWGIGPSANYRYRETKWARADTNEVLQTTGYIDREWSIGATAAVGIELFVWDKISLLGEYGFNIMYHYSKSSYFENPYKTIKISSKSVRLGLNVFF